MEPLFYGRIRGVLLFPALFVSWKLPGITRKILLSTYALNKTLLLELTPSNRVTQIVMCA